LGGIEGRFADGGEAAGRGREGRKRRKGRISGGDRRQEGWAGIGLVKS